MNEFWMETALIGVGEILTVIAGGAWFACTCENLRKYLATKSWFWAWGAGVTLMLFILGATKFATRIIK